LFEELAARADWAVSEPANCNHAPVITTTDLDRAAKAGETVSLKGSATDPDGDNLNVTWWIPTNACTYENASEAELTVSKTSGWKTTFTVPSDAKSGDLFVVNMEVQDDAERPMTRFAQFFITVE
jgi:hypothetical protein